MALAHRIADQGLGQDVSAFMPAARPVASTACRELHQMVATLSRTRVRLSLFFVDLPGADDATLDSVVACIDGAAGLTWRTADHRIAHLYAGPRPPRGAGDRIALGQFLRRLLRALRVSEASVERLPVLSAHHFWSQDQSDVTLLLAGFDPVNDDDPLLPPSFRPNGSPSTSANGEDKH
ncbi:hypothetical protein [Oceanibacterium hippocampi]|uniref:Uncharacterized protein n=1 Tax=Oceanibacterium hippocampi TaxID=745714 RepID=A0A1Y5TBN3_9PROT|nr:hypothetical protein [Oceanibacterium hippocampi]SLN58391.1 hypothetical protein OCH7691_02567 [Oceanibacterium hippocampi]